MSARWLTAEQATAELSVSRQTLYAYVSRGRIGVMAAPEEPRRSLADAADVHRLAERKRDGRSRRAVAASTISWGEPILTSAITRIEGGGWNIATRMRLGCRLVRRWKRSRRCCGRWMGCRDRGLRRRWPRARGPAGVAERCIAAIADLAMAGRWTGRTESVLADAMRILDLVAWAASGLPGVVVKPSALPMHVRLAAAWGVGVGADMIRRALMLMADHELNASTYATRVVASTRAPLGACVLGGLAALVGPLHGGVTNELRAFLAEPAVVADAAGAVATRLARGERVPAFGHPLYPNGDPRAAALLSRLPARGAARQVAEAMRVATGVPPNIDYALVVVEQQLRLPVGAAFALFAVGRTVGWIAHALEQWQSRKLIRPRAVYEEAG